MPNPIIYQQYGIRSDPGGVFIRADNGSNNGMGVIKANGGAPGYP